MADWWEAEQRRTGAAGPPAGKPAPPSEGVPDDSGLTPEASGLAVPPAPVAPQASSSMPTPLALPSRRRHGWVPMTRLWALVKMASLAYTTWWAMGYVHAGVGTTVSAYGAVCLFAGFGARWRKRFFGPGQLIEPELYEEIGRWLYRIGVVLVLVGGAAVTAQYAAH